MSTKNKIAIDFKYELERLEKAAAETANSIALAFKGDHAPGLRSIWLEERLLLLLKLEHQYKALAFVIDALNKE